MRRSHWLTILMAVVLTVPMLRECCLPVIVLHPADCHHSSETGNESCSWSQEATAENRSILPPNISAEGQVALAGVTPYTNHGSAVRVAQYSVPVEAFTPSLYLRTGALLI